MTTYTVHVKTGDREHAGTDANVFIQLIGAIATSTELKLDNKNINDFERRSLSSFQVSTDEVGWIDKIRLCHDDTGKHSGWYVEYVNVINQDTKLEYHADFYRWLAKSEGDGLIDITMPVPVINVSLNAGVIKSFYMGREVIHKCNESSVEQNYDVTFSNVFEKGVSLKVNSLFSVNLGAKISAKILGLGCEFTYGITRTVINETNSYEKQTFTSTTTSHFKLQPDQCVTIVSLFYQNICEGDAFANGARITFEQKLDISQDNITFNGWLSEEEIDNAVRNILQKINPNAGVQISKMPKPLPEYEAYILLAETSIHGPINASSINQALAELKQYPHKTSKGWILNEYLNNINHSQSLENPRIYTNKIPKRVPRRVPQHH